MTGDQLKELQARLATIRGHLDIDKRAMSVSELQDQSLDPNFWNDSKRAEGIMRDLKLHKSWIEKYNVLQEMIDEVEVLYDFQKMEEATEEEVNEKYNKAVANQCRCWRYRKLRLGRNADAYVHYVRPK